VRAASAVGPDMSGLQNGEGSLLGHGAPPSVDVGDQYSERPLPESRQDGDRLSIARLRNDR
jgi:hypothetical protein